jgi:hypothetical protein
VLYSLRLKIPGLFGLIVCFCSRFVAFFLFIAITAFRGYFVW